MIFRKNIKHLSDQQLLILYKEKRDQQVLAELFTRYTHMVLGVCMKYLQHEEDASDAVMSVYEKLCKDIHRHEILNFPTWLYVITKNFCLMELRSRKTNDKRHELWQEDQLVFMESQSIMHPLDEDNKDTFTLLNHCMEQLKNDQRICIELFYYKKKCYQEIAETLKMDEKKVKSHLQNGKRNLKICLDHQHEKESK